MSRRYPADRLMEHLGVTSIDALAKQVRVDTATATLAVADGLTEGQARSWCKVLGTTVEIVWALRLPAGWVRKAPAVKQRSVARRWDDAFTALHAIPGEWCRVELFADEERARRRLATVRAALPKRRTGFRFVVDPDDGGWGLFARWDEPGTVTE
jgi:hypothetical protein